MMHPHDWITMDAEVACPDLHCKSCYMSRQTYVEVKDTYFEGGTHEETLRPQSKAKVLDKRREGKVTIRQTVDS